MNNGKRGLVSIGLPVFRGERFIAEAIESVLAQTYTEFELIILDNASDDGTAAICERYAARDGRIAYQRNNATIGVSDNHNRVFRMASGEYFRWLAHDDRMAPECVARCVAALEADPAAGLCYTATRVIDDQDREVVVRPITMKGADSLRASDRFAAVLFGDRFMQSVFGVFRSEVFAQTGLLRAFHNSDRVLIGELALIAPILYIGEPLFDNRHHASRYTSLSRPQDRAAWQQASGFAARCPMWTSYACHIGTVLRHVSGTAERLRCFGHLARWWLVDWHAAMMAVELAATAAPGVFDVAQRLKHRWVGDVTRTISAPDR